MAPHEVVFLLDVDNTLLDNDAVIEDLKQHLIDAIGAECQQRYWELFEQLREELGYADYLGALQRYRIERPSGETSRRGAKASGSIAKRSPGGWISAKAAAMSPSSASCSPAATRSSSSTSSPGACT